MADHTNGRRFDVVALLALILTLVAQSAVVTYWGGRLAEKVDGFERGFSEFKERNQAESSEHDARIRLLEEAVIRLSERKPR